MNSLDILIVGAGIYGLPTALELSQRGYQVGVLDSGPVPHPLAASTDISKVIRMEYGADERYMELMETGLKGWLSWNDQWCSEGHRALFHQTGVVMLCQGEMEPGGFEFESYRMLLKRGHLPERMATEDITRNFPAWNADVYCDGFYHSKGGYAESGNVIEALTRQAIGAGVSICPDTTVTGLLLDGETVTGVSDHHGQTYHADRVVLATGAWTSSLVPDLSASIVPNGQPVFHIKPSRPDLFEPRRFPVFTADIARTGYYGFPLHETGIVKIANHGKGVLTDPGGDRFVTPQDKADLRDFLAKTFPSLVDDEIAYTRLCLYSDSPDGHFWIDHHPVRPGLVVASGGSGHGFKFAPVLGQIIADTVEGKPSSWSNLFRWRGDLQQGHGREAARRS